MTNSKHKEEAWGAISQLFFSSSFQSEINTHAHGIPVRKSTVKSLLNGNDDVSDTETLSEETGKKPFDSSINAAYELPDGTEIRLTAEQKRQLADLIESVEIDPFVNTAMEQIIKEESDYVFEGERSTEQCVDILQSRIGLYLSEMQ